MTCEYDFITFSIVDQCNLRCPSCPSEHLSKTGRLRFAPLDLCGKVLARIARDYGSPRISLYCLSEPLLHPDLPAILDIAQRHGLKLEISTNLNTMRDLRPIIGHPALARFDISVSGLTQETYERGHGRNASIALVRKNMEAIAGMPRTAGIFVKYLQYRDNLGEGEEMQDLARSLGFSFSAIPATYFPYGDIIEAAAAGREFVPPEEVGPLLDRLLVRDVWKVHPTTAFAGAPCYNQERILFLNWNAELFSCNFATYHDFGRLGSFLDQSAQEIRELKASLPFCGTCRRLGIQAQNAVKSALESGEELAAFFAFLDSPDAGARPRGPILIFGAGWLGRQIGTCLAARGLEVAGFLDDDPEKIGRDADGIPVMALADAPADLLGRAAVVSGMFAPARLRESLNERLRAAGGGPMRSLGAFLLSVMNERRKGRTA